MPNWKNNFKVKDLLTDHDVAPEEARLIGYAVAKRITDRQPFDSETNAYLAEAFETVWDQDEFNEALSDLYDRADAQRVWIN